MGIEPVPIKMYGDPDADKKFKKTVSVESIILNYRKKLIPMETKRRICFITMGNLT